MILITVIAALYAFVLYRKDSLLEEVSKSIKIVMAGFRFVSIWLILFLLIGIIIENFVERKEHPIIFVAQDNSESIIMTKDSGFYRTTYLESLNKLSGRLREQFEVIEYSFSDVPENNIVGTFDGKFTDITSLFNQIFDQYSNRNIGAIIMATDGIYNTGANPIYAVAQKSFIPVYTVGMGDTNLVRDTRIELVNHNDIAFLGNEFPVEVVFSGIKANTENVQVSILKDGKQVSRQDFRFDSDFSQGKLVFMLKANGTGFQRYTARVSTIDNEFSIKNNELSFYVEVIDGRQKILIAHDAPHPDVAALRYVIDNNQNYQTEVKFIKEIEAVNEYDLVIVHNYQKSSGALDDAVSKGIVPFLFINGTATDMRNLQNLKIGFSGTGSGTEELGFSHNTSFKDILLSPKIIQMITSSPPLHAPFGNLSFSDALDVLAYQKVGSIQLDNPLIYFTYKEKSRIGVIMGEGIWRWRLYDQMRNKSTLQFEEFFSKLITYLAVKDNKDPFRINIENEYNESDEIIIGAELYNKSFELINEPEVIFTFSDEEEREFSPAFFKTKDAYQLNLGKLKAGIYNWQAKTNFQEKNYTKSGTFLVKEIKLEWMNTTADHRLLRNISENSGGKFYFPDQLEKLGDDLITDKNLATIVYQEKSFDDIIDFKWIFVLIIIMVSAEWFFRKYNGAY